MITCLGSDEYARLHRDNFARYGINTDAVYTAPGSSGVAPIWVEPDGTNRIIVVPGANDALSEADARRAVERVGSVDAVVGQCEVPQPVTAAAFTAARRRGAVTILNPAPATELSSELMSVTDWLIPNEHEMNLAGSDLDDASLRSYATTNQVSVIVTLGEAGVALVTAGDVQRLPAPTVRAIDTTGAGDAFVGAFAFAIAKGMTPTQSGHRRHALRVGQCHAARRSVVLSVPRALLGADPRRWLVEVDDQDGTTRLVGVLKVDPGTFTRLTHVEAYRRRAGWIHVNSANHPDVAGRRGCQQFDAQDLHRLQ